MTIADPQHDGAGVAPSEIDPVEIPWLEPRDGVPPLIEDDAALAAYAAALAGGSGPVAIDAERASGFKYSQRAYLVQLRREGAGIGLVDPTCFPDLAPIQAATVDAEWILHAATQDLACLREAGLVPSALFDTELAGRLLGRERVSLAALVESELGARLQKGHGAADWSQRPLSAAQLRYAALDVELLIELRDSLEASLAEAGKLDWAREEFEALLDFLPKERGEDAWRRTSGMHRVRRPRALAVVRQLWRTRDTIAQRIDTAPGRVLNDAAIVAAATAMPTSITELGALPEFANRGAQRRLRHWWEAIEQAMALPDAELPGSAGPPTGPPPPRTWPDKRPEAAARLDAARSVMAGLSARVSVPVENLLQPEALRRACWDGVSGDELGEMLLAGGARPWQVELAVPLLAPALDDPASAPTASTLTADAKATDE